MECNSQRSIKLDRIFSATIFKVSLILSFCPVSKTDTENSKAAVLLNHGATDGEKFIRRLVHGEKINRPEYLMFTAPYKLCEGGCKDSNLVLSFPLWVGKKGRSAYRNLYSRDWKSIHTEAPLAPFKRKTTRPPTTTTTKETCPTFTSKKASEQSTTTEASATSLETTLEPYTEVQTSDYIATDPEVELYMDNLIHNVTTPFPVGRCVNISGLCWKRTSQAVSQSQLDTLSEYDMNDEKENRNEADDLKDNENYSDTFDLDKT